MTSDNKRSAAPLPPEFELPHEVVIPETAGQTAETSSAIETSDAEVVNGIIELADKEEYVDEP